MNIQATLHTVVGVLVLAGAGSLAALHFPEGSILGDLSRTIVAAQALLVVGAANLYVMVKTPFKHVISSSADVWDELEVRWRAGMLTDSDTQFARSSAVEIASRVLAIMLFAGLGLGWVL